MTATESGKYVDRLMGREPLTGPGSGLVRALLSKSETVATDAVNVDLGNCGPLVHDKLRRTNW
jgi:hypothetical protein